MYFVVIVAFALLLADGLPPARWNVLPIDLTNPTDLSRSVGLTIAFAGGLLMVVGIVAAVGNRLAVRKADGTHDGLDRVQEWYNYGNLAVLVALVTSTQALFICTPWMPLVRNVWGLRRYPLVADLVILVPFFASILLAWICLFPADRIIRAAAMEQRVQDGARARPIWGLGEYLYYKFRHQILMIAVPMSFVLVAKHYIDEYRAPLIAVTRIPWAADALLGLSSGLVLLIAPALVARTWATRPLPPGPLRDRLNRQCGRMKLKYRDILIWDSQGLIVNAAVMGFVAPLRYVMLSDGLLETMRPQQIEAVFGHEAGHVRHHHLQFFVLFALLSMMIVGGILEVVFRFVRVDIALLQLIAMALTLLVWGLGFGWVSRRFERQADVFGVRAITPDIELCVPACTIHAPAEPELDARVETYGRRAGLCVSAAHLFGTTLQRIAELNGIPPAAPSWRHGSIQSRCQMIVELADDPRAIARFDRRLRRLKTGMIALTLIGAAIAAWLYWPTEFFRAVFGR